MFDLSSVCTVLKNNPVSFTEIYIIGIVRKVPKDEPKSNSWINNKLLHLYVYLTKKENLISLVFWLWDTKTYRNISCELVRFVPSAESGVLRARDRTLRPTPVEVTETFEGCKFLSAEMRTKLFTVGPSAHTCLTQIKNKQNKPGTGYARTARV